MHKCKNTELKHQTSITKKNTWLSYGMLNDKIPQQ